MVTIAGCGSSGASTTRSVKNFCDTYRSQKAQFQGKYASLESGATPTNAAGVMTDLVMGLQSLGDVSVILQKLDAVAPPDIEPDVAAVLSSWKSMESTLGDEASNAFNPTGLFGTFVKGLLVSAESGGSWQRLGNYVQQNCGGA